MGAGGLIIAAALVGGGFWAYKQGYLNKLFAAAGNAASGSGTLSDLFVPASAPVAAPNQWEQKLRDNWAYVSPWARANVQWVAAMMQQESGSQGSAARGSAGEVGLMQVKPSTAEELRNRGYGQLTPTVAVLGTDSGGIYFGTAYLDYLSGIKSDRAWITKAYNGGPGWESLTETYKAAREAYYKAVAAKYSGLYAAGSVV